MKNLLEASIEAHGGLDKWRGVRTADVRLNFSGAVLERKGMPRHLQPSCTIDVEACRVTFDALIGSADRVHFSPNRVWSEWAGGGIREERRNPLASFAGHTLDTKWDTLHLTYFLGYSLWNYLAAPFVFVNDGYEAHDVGEHQEDGETWRMLDVTYPNGVPTHSKVQRFYFGPDLLIRRLDYTVDLLRGTAAHYCSDHKAIDGIMIPLVRRIVIRNEDGPRRTGPSLFLLDYTDVKLRH